MLSIFLGIDPEGYMEAYTTWRIAQKANNWSGVNVVRWSHADYDALWRQAQAELDPVQRAALFIRMNDMLVEHNVVVPITWRHGVSAASHKLRGMDLTPWDSELWHLAYWYRET
jgi:peptide/nickel transport system substrate-binding protein